MNAEQQAAFDRMLQLEGAIRRTRKQHEREAYAEEWRRLQAIVDGAESVKAGAP